MFASIHAQSRILSQEFWPLAADSSSGLRRAAVLAFVGTMLLALSAKVQVPFWPVPLTMQPFMVLVLGMAYGHRLAAATLLLYLAEGALGMPVFAKGGGLVYFSGPTGGYLIGFVFAAALTGWLAAKGWDKKIWTTVAAMFLGLSVIYCFGVGWLSYLIGWEKAIAAGMLPFLPGDAAKIVLAALLLPYTWKLIDKRRHKR